MEEGYAERYVGIDFREHPEKYRVGRGEEGVLLAEPYKSEILPHWRFRTPEIAEKSAEEIFHLYERYRDASDFVGMDMARKYLQMGYTRARRYANHKSGKKYDGPVPREKRGQSGAHGRETLPQDPDPVKAQSAAIFKERWKQVEDDPAYRAAREQHKERYG